MARCDRCGEEEPMPYRCRLCGGTYCADHRLPENHDCPGLESWNDPGGVFDSGFDDSVDQSASSWIPSAVRPSGFGVWRYLRGNMTYAFLAAMWLTFFAQFAIVPALGYGPESALWRAIFVLSPRHPEYVWTWVTSIFAHGGIFHIAVNSIVIYFFGRLAEQYLGSKRFTGLFLVSGVLAGLGQVMVQLLQSGAVVGGVVGASGAGLAIMGVLTVLNPGLRVYLYFILPMPLWLLTIGYAVFTVFNIYQGGAGAGGVAQVAHLIGLAVGLAFGEYVKDEVRSPSSMRFGGRRGGPGGGRGPF
ncbi:MAG: rhomboid family intramembrane serine protease [Halobacteriaceae archaeon]